ncbi:ATP-binding protein [Kineococcus rubinsiae]|uniref:ATP-binding protein n=1 Tax=Kineococcus rubinsiae TaxID=2609562 RepID=UPI0014300FFD|nr:ATP-binding protein [Kineococcus rubinsiae]NIZ91413.1 cyclic nucleotide-binding domain-containing protein [Kineococcus rubinsiae]
MTLPGVWRDPPSGADAAGLPPAAPDAARVPAAELRSLFLFESLSDSKLEWLSRNGERRTYAADAVVFREGDPAEWLFLLLEGEICLLKSVAGQQVSLSTSTHRGAYAGATRAFVTDADHTYANTMKALSASSFYLLPAEHFARFVRGAMPMAVHLLDGLFIGMQNSEATIRQREHLARLGTLSAGLAHELNNPAAAAVRAAAQLSEPLAALAGSAAAFARVSADEDFLARAEAVRADAVAHACTAPALGALDRADAEDEVTDLLEDADVDGAPEVAVTLVGSGLDAGWVSAALQRLAGPARSEAFAWLAAVVEAESLAREIGDATEAISALVAAVKEYSYLDSSAVQDVDLHAGLDSTLRMLAHKLRGITVQRDFAPDLPRVSAYGAELNQVWTNLLDNAAAATGGTGTVRLRTSHAAGRVRVEIADDGPGIPPEAQPRVFEAFFTTKGPGAGTGLGLDSSRRIVEDRHHGSIGFTTGPAGTTFAVELPVQQVLR